MSLSSGEQALFDRTNYPAVALAYISQPEMVFEAPISGVHYSNKGIVALTFGTPTIGAYTDIDAGMTVDLHDGSQIVGSQRVRKAATSDVIFVGRSPRGSRVGELNAESASTVRVYKERRVWSKNPYISNNGTQYKDELAYPGDDEAQPPVANAGPDLLIVSTSGSETISLDALGDISSFAVRNGASLDTYAWDLDDGSVDTGTVNDSSLTATFGYGERYVALTVTDDNGVSHTAYKFVVVARPSDCIPVKVTQRVIRRDGVTMQIQVDGNDLPTNIREQAKILYAAYEGHGDYGNEYLRFSGWLGTSSDDLADARQQRNTITIECYDIAQRLRQLYGFPLSVSRDNSDTGWYRLPDCTIDNFTHHYLQWHCNAIDLCDFQWSGQGATYPLPQFTTQGASLWDQAQRLARAIAFELTCNTKGQLRVVGDPISLPTSSQASTYSLPTQRTSSERLTLTTSDYGGKKLSGNVTTRTYWHRASAVVAGTDPDEIGAVKCVAPAATPAQGVSTVEDSEQLVIGQDELNVRTGNRYASRTAPRVSGLTLELVKTWPVIEPADMVWVVVELPSDDQSRYDWSASGERCLPIDINERYNHARASVATTITLETEYAGLPAETVVDPPQAASNFPEWEDIYVPVLNFPQYGELQMSLVAGVGNIIGITSIGHIVVTTNFSNPSWEGGPTWVDRDFSGTLGGVVLAYTYRAGATNISAWIVTEDGIYYGENLQDASPTFTLQYTFPATVSQASIDSDYINYPGLFAVCTFYDTSVSALRSVATVDGGSTWSSPATVISASSSSPSGVQVSPVEAGVAYAHNRDGSVLTAVRRTSNYGASWFALSTEIGATHGVFNQHVPLAEGNLIYYGVLTNGGLRNRFYRSVFSFPNGVEISPEVGGLPVGPHRAGNRFTISVSEQDSNVVALCASYQGSGADGYVFLTRNGKASSPDWISLFNAETEYTGLALVNNASELYCWGDFMNIGYSDEPFNPLAFDDRSGNLPDIVALGASSFRGIAGF